jgi:hypothetical protein
MFHSLPRELRDIIYSYVYTPSDEEYMSFSSASLNAEQTVCRPIRVTDRLKGALGLHLSCRRLYVEAFSLFGKMERISTVHVRLLSLEDADFSSVLIPQLRLRFPGLQTLTVTTAVSGDFIYLISHLPRGTWPKRLQLEIIHKPNTSRMTVDPHSVLSLRTNYYMFFQEPLGHLKLKEHHSVQKQMIKLGQVVDHAWILTFE